MKRKDKKLQSVALEDAQFGAPDAENPEWTAVDFARAKPNRFAQYFVTLDEDVIKYFPTPKRSMMPCAWSYPTIPTDSAAEDGDSVSSFC